MASSSSVAPAQLGHPVSEKLSRSNYMLWKAQILPAIRGAKLIGVLNGTTKAPPPTLEVTKDDKTTATIENPAYDQWLAQDQQLLSYLFNSLTTDVLGQVATLDNSAAVWSALEVMYSAQSRAKVTNLWMQLSNLKKGSMTSPVYFAKMKGIGDELAAAGKPVGDDQMVSFILSGLDYDYNPLVSYVVGRIEPTSLTDLYAQLVAYDTRLDMLQENSNGGQFQSSANSAVRGRGGFRGRGNNRGRGRGRSNGGRTRAGGFQAPRQQNHNTSGTGSFKPLSNMWANKSYSTRMLVPI